MSILTVAYTNKALSDGRVLVENSQGDSVTSRSGQELLDFIAKNYTPALNRKMTWNLDAFLAPILKLLGLEVCKELVKEPDCEALFEFIEGGIQVQEVTGRIKELPEGRYSLYYHRGTSCGLLKHGERKSYFYNLSQFYESDEAITDPAEILKKANEVVGAFFSMGMNPLKMSSPVSVYQSNVLEHLEIPTLVNIPTATLTEAEIEEMVNWSEEIMHREWTTALAVGHWAKGESWDYDIQSAYGYLFSELYDYRYADFVKSDVPVKDAYFGLLKGKVTINEGVKCSPICYETPEGQTINPVGCSWDDIITLPEARFIYRWGIGAFELDYGYFWTQNAPVKPFEATMQRIFDHRLQGGLVKKLAKRIGASAWSKCIQKAGNGESYYSPLLALQVKTNCRMKVADFIYKHGLQASVIHIGTDGLRATKRVEIPNWVGMGLWKENQPDPCIILSPGRIYTPTHKPGGLYYDDIITMVKKAPQDTYYATKLSRPITLGEAVELGNLKKVGEIGEFQTSIDLMTARGEQDMSFPTYPAMGKELLDNKCYGEAVSIKEGG